MKKKTDTARTVNDILDMQKAVKEIRVTDDVKKYIITIVNATRGDRNTTFGISPRGSIALYKASKAFAYIYEREYVTPDDVKNTAVAVLSHRIILSPQGKTAYGTSEGYVTELLQNIPVPAMGIR